VNVRQAHAARLIIALVASVLSFNAAQAQPAPVRFAVIGDYGEAGNGVPGRDNELDVANLIKCWDQNKRLDFIITTGDNNYPKGKFETIHKNIGRYYREFIDLDDAQFGPDDGVNRFWPSLGNHDWGQKCHNPTGAAPYLRYFQALGNQRYYEHRQEAVHVFALNSDCNEADSAPDNSPGGSKQRTWLMDKLAASDARWKIVYFHHPPYSSGSHGNSDWMQWPFKRWGASIVLAGHDHDYERLIVDDFPYIVNGLSGKDDRPFSFTRPGSKVRFHGDNGAILATATDDYITFRFITRKGRVADTYTITAPGHTAPAPEAEACPRVPLRTLRPGRRAAARRLPRR
jgi:hypothetical protein